MRAQISKRPNQRVEANRRPASPLHAGREFGPTRNHLRLDDERRVVHQTAQDVARFSANQRYMVGREILSVRQMSPTSIFLSACNALAV